MECLHPALVVQQEAARVPRAVRLNVAVGSVYRVRVAAGARLCGCAC
jgi:hypothetical protein